MAGKEKSQEHFSCLFDTPRGVRLKLSWQAKFFSVQPVPHPSSHSHPEHSHWVPKGQGLSLVTCVSLRPQHRACHRAGCQWMLGELTGCRNEQAA